MTELKIGWKEWVSLPDLQIPAIKAKTDTGARTSALHADRITVVMKPSGPWVRYIVRPLRRKIGIAVQCESRLLDRRDIKNSGGQVESRYVIETTLVLGDAMWPVKLTLTNREDMLFPMLLGRTALRDRVIIYPGEKYLTGSVRIKKCYPELRTGKRSPKKAQPKS